MTKCNSAECPQKEKCLRWTIPSNPYQYYLDFYAVRAKKDCEYFKMYEEKKQQ